MVHSVDWVCSISPFCDYYRGSDPGKYDEDGKLPLYLDINTELTSIKPYLDVSQAIIKGTGHAPIKI